MDLKLRKNAFTVGFTVSGVPLRMQGDSMEGKIEINTFKEFIETVETQIGLKKVKLGLDKAKTLRVVCISRPVFIDKLMKLGDIASNAFSYGENDYDYIFVKVEEMRNSFDMIFVVSHDENYVVPSRIDSREVPVATGTQKMAYEEQAIPEETSPNNGIEVISTVLVKSYKNYDLKKQIWRGAGCDTDMMVAYSKDGGYIGLEQDAKTLCKKRGIKPELIDKDHKVCSIGFNEKEQKWYGWSHRAIFGFGIGSSVKKGDCGYIPKNKREFIANVKAISAKETSHKHIIISRPTGIQDVAVFLGYKDDPSQDKFIGDVSGGFYEYKYGHGEWTAKTLEDAKQMAIDFANSVS